MRRRDLTWIVALLTAVTVFLAGFGAVVLVTQDTGTRATRAADDASLDVQAYRLATALLGSAGTGWRENVACAGGSLMDASLTADAVTSVGLATEPCAKPPRSGAYVLDYHKVMVEHDLAFVQRVRRVHRL